MYEKVSLPVKDERQNIVCDKCGKTALEIPDFYYDEERDRMLCKVCICEEER
ncbi:MAG: hypothetical protein BWY04_01419 [candidate division CPR1 bacterium ADurb.Bin160]|uniref:Uncharacterized protein n=1 Tax=candidate division CPR1 bacterium ADurb.Bin160 TaxID=1852826 RepID=A0A1V5ZJC2_9BACT|nr:MAG: hypothetical protein BWY04_01419 [candidate division CPR1 bacterium ADurb.Bin160]